MAHESERYGFLVLNGAPLTDAQIVNTVAGSTRKMLAELDTARVFSRDESGAIYSRRMVRDEKLREVRAACGQLGGNPNLLGKKDKQTPTKNAPEVPTKVNPFPTPSSSDSSASSSNPASVETPTDSARAPNGKNGAVENTENSTAKSRAPHWASDAAGVNATAERLGIHRHQQEDDAAFKDRVIATVNAKRVSDAAKASRGLQ